MLMEQKETGKFGQVISGLLQDKIESRLQKKEQIILLHNRRGYSPIISCADCGEISNCYQCNVSLTYHQSENSLLCRYCGFSEILYQKVCQICKSNNLLFKGTEPKK